MLALALAGCSSMDKRAEENAPTSRETRDEGAKTHVTSASASPTIGGESMATSEATGMPLVTKPPPGYSSAGPDSQTGNPNKVGSGPPPPPRWCAPGDPLCAEDEAPPPKRKARVEAASTQSMGGRLTPAQVEDAVEQSFQSFAACSSSDSTVTVRAVIAGTGKVLDASSIHSSPDDARLRDCVVSAFRQIIFPTSSDGRSVPISFDLVLAPAS
jgi:hypothetical protein